MTFEEWKDGYGLVLEPNYSKETEADCLAAFNFGKRESAVLIERQAAQIEMLREALGHALNGLLYYHHAKLVKRGIDVANEALSATSDQALEQFAERVREQSLAEYRNKVIEACAKLCDERSAYFNSASAEHFEAADCAAGLRAMKEQP